MADSVYNSTTISYESSSARRPWNLSEIVSPPVTKSKWFQLFLLVGGSLILGLGLIVAIIGVYNQSYYNDDDAHMKPGGNNGDDETPGAHWIVILLGSILAVLGLVLLLIYCRLRNPRSFCYPLTTTRNVIRNAVTKPRLHNGQTNQGATLLTNDSSHGHPVSTQYDPVTEISYDTSGHPNPEIFEERAKLMAHEAKEGPSSRSTQTQLPHQGKQNNPSPLTNHPQSHYKPRHFASHGYGLQHGQLPLIMAPLATAEDITPSLRSSYASIMMYAPSLSIGDSDESLPSAIFNVNSRRPGSPTSLSIHSAFS